MRWLMYETWHSLHASTRLGAAANTCSILISARRRNRVARWALRDAKSGCMGAQLRRGRRMMWFPQGFALASSHAGVGRKAFIKGCKWAAGQGLLILGAPDTRWELP